MCWYLCELKSSQMYMKTQYKIGGKYIQRGGNYIQRGGGEIYDGIKNLPSEVLIISALVIIAILVKMIFGFISTEYAQPTLATYGSSIGALLILLFVTANMLYKQNTDKKESSGLIINTLPIILTIVVISLILAQNITFSKRLNSGNVSNDYVVLSNLSSILILFQAIGLIIYLSKILHPQTNTSDTEQIETSSTALFTRIGIGVLAIFNIILYGAQQVELQYFYTDG